MNRREIELEYCPTTEMIANLFTKPLSRLKFMEIHVRVMHDGNHLLGKEGDIVPPTVYAEDKCGEDVWAMA